jgi:hypothetical protein
LNAGVEAAKLCGGLPAPMIFRKAVVLQKSLNFVFIRQAQRLWLLVFHLIPQNFFRKCI